jgi:hypothetical protein
LAVSDLGDRNQAALQQVQDKGFVFHLRPKIWTRTGGN